MNRGLFVGVNGRIQAMSPEERFKLLCAPPDENGCIRWLGHTGRTGYGRIRVDGKNRLAHRVAYEWEVGPIPPGLQVDHLCRVRDCVNTEHMELVTPRENTLRGESPAARQARQTHCVRGHSLDDAFVYRGMRRCRACNRERMRRRTRR